MNWLDILEVFVPVIVACIPLLITVVTNGNKTRSSVVELSKKVDDHIKDDDFRAAKNTRIRILRFNDEICAGVKHSENHFEDILDDIDFYEEFCENHPDFHNNRGVLAMAHIKAVYSECKEKNSFLK